MDHNQIKELLPVAALGLLEDEEERIVREHLETGCQECHALLKELTEASARIAFAEESPKDKEKAQRLWQKIEARLKAQNIGSDFEPAVEHDFPDERDKTLLTTLSTLRKEIWPWRVATGMALGAAVVMGVMLKSTASELGKMERIHRAQIASLQGEAVELQRKLNAAQAELAALNRVLDERTRLEQVMMAPDARMMRLAPAGPVRRAQAMVVMSPKTGRAVIDSIGLPQPPQGKTYEMWWISKDHGPIAAGTFMPTAQGETVAQVSPPPSNERIMLAAVTLEPMPGTSKPTGQMYLKGGVATAPAAPATTSHPHPHPARRARHHSTTSKR